MAFWGIEVKPGKPYIYQFEEEKGRLHISQATLGDGSSTEKSILQCKVGDKQPIFLCSLFPERFETCQLSLELEEDDEVAFSIIGEHSVHLSGFFFGVDEEDDHGHCGSDYSDEDEMSTDSEDEDYYSEDDFEYGDLPVPKSGVIIEEIADEEKPTSENGLSKRIKKKKIDNETSIEAEDDDGFPIKNSDVSKDKKKSRESTGEKSQKENGNKLKRKIDAVGEDEKPTREDNLATEKQTKKQKNKNQKVEQKVESDLENGKPSSNVVEESPVAEAKKDKKSSYQKKKEKKMKKKNKQQESEATPIAEVKETDKDGPVFEKLNKKTKPLQVRTFPNGLEIEELAMGKPAGKRATRGKKVSVSYIGKLKKNGKFFDSNIGQRPFQFRLGIGKVIKGWDVGLEGMRVGDKRRLTIPPAMGYGNQKQDSIPPNSWLVFDVELLNVH